MTNYDILKLARYIAGERLPGKAVSQGMFGLLLDNAQLKHFKRKVGLPETYRPGMPLPEQAYDITQKLTEDLRKFKVHMGDDTTPLIVTNGKAELPRDYYYCSTIVYKHVRNTTVRERLVEVVNDLQWAERLSSSIITPTLKYPIANFQSDYLRVSPRTIRYLDFIYLRLPKEPTLKFKTENGVLTYDSSSQELEWDDVNKIDIIHILLGDMGINLGKPELVQYSELHKSKGI